MPPPGRRRAFLSGLLVFAAGSALAGLALSGMVVGEAGFMLGSVALTMLATGALDERDGGLAAGVLNTATQLGGAVGLGVVATVVTATAGAQTTAPALRYGFLACLCFAALCLLTVRSAREPA